MKSLEVSFRSLTHLGIESCRGVSRSVRQQYALQCHTNASQYERVIIASNAAAYEEDELRVSKKQFQSNTLYVDDAHKPARSKKTRR